MPHHIYTCTSSVPKQAPSLVSTRTLCTQPRDGARRPDPAPRSACGGLWAQLAVYDMDGPVDAGKMPSLTPGESAPRSISTRLSSLSRALSPWSGLGVVVGVRIGVAGLGSESGSADLSYV